MEHLEAADIDEWHDFLWVEFLMKKIKLNENFSIIPFGPKYTYLWK